MIRAFLADFRDFFLAVFSNWQGWLSGGGMGGAVLIILALWERGMGKSMDNSLKMTQSFSAGDVSTGWFWSVFPDVRLGKLHDEGAMVVVSFCDAITGNRHYLRRPLTLKDRLHGQMTTIEKVE